MLGRSPRGRLGRRWQVETDDHVISLKWAPGGALLAAAAVGGPVRVLDAASGAVKHDLPGHDFGTAAVGWSAAGELASGGQDGKVRFWDLTRDAERLAVAGGAAQRTAWVERLAWHPTEPLLAAAAGRAVRLWAPGGALRREWTDHKSTVSDLAWRPGARELAVSAYGSVTFWSPDAAAPLKRFEWPGSVLALAWSPDGKLLATGDQDATVHFWDYTGGQDLQMSGYAVKVRELAWDCVSRYLATGGGPVVTVWDCDRGGKGPAGSTPLQFQGHDGLVAALAFQKAGPLLASGGQDGAVILWQPGKYRTALGKSDAGAEVTQLAWSPDDRLLAVGCASGRVAVYDVS
jgi:WD40 repeat protein